MNFLTLAGICLLLGAVYAGRRAAFRQAKRDAGIPIAQHPEDEAGKQYKKVPMTDRNGKSIKGDDGKPIMTREYSFKTRPEEENSEIVVIQDHEAGHDFGDENQEGNQGPHFNVRPEEDTRNGKVNGAEDHYEYDK